MNKKVTLRKKIRMYSQDIEIGFGIKRQAMLIKKKMKKVINSTLNNDALERL